MDLFQNMRVFVRVAEAGSFVAAARQLNLSTPHVSRLVAELESHLRVRLLNRTTRRVALTATGERFLTRSQHILSLLEEAKSEAADAQAHPSGRLRVHCIISFGQRHLIPMIARYRQLYPEVTVDLTLSQRLPDLLDEGYDIALTVASSLPDSGMMVQRIANTQSVLCASPEYLAKKGEPRTPQELLNHDCIRIVSLMFPREWHFRRGDRAESIEVSGPFTVNVPEALTIAVREGMGVGLLPVYAASQGLKDGTLRRLMPEYQLQEHTVFAIYPSRQFLDARTKTLLEFLRRELPTAIAASEAVMA